MNVILQPWHLLFAALLGSVTQRQQRISDFQNAQIEALLNRLNNQQGDDTLGGGELTRFCLTRFGERPTVPPHTREANRSREQFESFAPLGPSVPGTFLARQRRSSRR